MPTAKQLTRNTRLRKTLHAVADREGIELGQRRALDPMREQLLHVRRLDLRAAAIPDEEGGDE